MVATRSNRNRRLDGSAPRGRIPAGLSLRERMAQWLSPAEAAAHTGLSRSTLMRAEARRELVTYRTPGGHRRYARGELDEFIEQRKG
jgi:excisionase family DNA binding protein